jgi:hypothetical protein
LEREVKIILHVESASSIGLVTADSIILGEAPTLVVLIEITPPSNLRQ